MREFKASILAHSEDGESCSPTNDIGADIPLDRSAQPAALLQGPFVVIPTATLCLTSGQ
jgi:hypothetical protein